MYVLFCCIVALDFATSPKTQKAPYKVLSALVPRAGVEPARTYKVRGILSPLCLPISPPGQHFLGGAFQSRTGLYEFAIRCITALLTRHTKLSSSGAGNEVRTRDPNHGKVMLYQLSYARVLKNGAHYIEL